MSNWAALQTKAFTPYFCPGKKFIRETMEEQNNALLQKHFQGGDGTCGSACGEDHGVPLTAEQDLLFKDIKYTAPAYCEMFPDEFAAARELVCKDKYSIDFAKQSRHRAPQQSSGKVAHAIKT